MARFAHISDTHIRNLKYQKEYREIFKNLYKELKNRDIDYIIHCGDIAHTKTQISPEFVELASDFLKNLAEIAPTYVILGNHDGNLRNSSRQDALTPIVEALDMPSLHLLKKSSEVQLDDTFTLNVLSVFDTENWKEISNSEKINIALYHGAVKGAVTDVGYIIEHGDVDIKMLSKFDFAFLGDIHKSNQILDKRGRVRYAGSTIQQNHGETNDKGFLVWDIQGRDKYTTQHVPLENPSPFITVDLTSDGKIPKSANIPKGCKLRIIANTALSAGTIQKVTDIAKLKHGATSVSLLNRASATILKEQSGEVFDENLQDITVQERLIKSYLDGHELEDKVLEEILNLNKKYNAELEQSDQIRNVSWNLKRMEWDNLFNYGADNFIDFDKLNGVVGIFGKNFSGKSSIIDSMLFGLYNSTSKSAKKNINFVNQNKDSANISLELDIGADTYTIERKIDKYKKKLKGKITDEAKINVDFNVFKNKKQENLNGDTRSDTDKNIRKYFGTLEDFLITSMSSQHGSLQFVEEGSTKRKEILAKFLDLENFDKKFKMAKEDSNNIKGAIKRLQGIDYDEEIFELEKQIIKNGAHIREAKENCQEIKDNIRSLSEQEKELTQKIESVPAEVIDVESVKKKLTIAEETLSTLSSDKEEIRQELKDKKELLKKIEAFIKTFDVDSYQVKKESISEKASSLRNIINEIQQEEIKEKLEKKKVSLLSEVPCGPEFSSCKFIKDAYSAKKEVEVLQLALSRLQSERADIENQIKELKPEQVDDYLEKYNQVLTKLQKTKSDVAKVELSKIKKEEKIKNTTDNLQNLKDSIEQYEANKDAIENLEKLLLEKKQIKGQIKELEREYHECESNYLLVHKESGILEERLENTRDQQREYQDLENKFTAYNLFMSCCHPNGISYEIIKRKLPILNEEVQKILSNVVNFQVLFESDEKKLNILIKHPKYDPRPLELGSGAEKSMAAMAIRLALLSVSSLPKGNIFILDEPGTALDETNLEGFVEIVSLIKAYFKTVLLISHMDELKDIVDITIDIDKNNGYASVRQ